MACDICLSFSNFQLSLEIDVTICPRCKGRIEQITVIKNRVAIAEILKSLNQVTVFQPLEAVDIRGPPVFDEYSQDFQNDEF